MKKPIKNLTEPERLRQKAEETYKEQMTKVSAISDEPAILKLYHELSVHKIELEIQNEDLLRAKAELEVANNKYTDLYDFAPTGYVTLSQDGKILGMNLCAAKMLGGVRQRLMKNVFSTFMTDDSKQNFYHFINEIFSSLTEQSCEVVLFRKGNSLMYVYLVGMASKDGKSCDISMIDISQRKSAELTMDELLNKVKASNKDLQDFAYVASHDLQEPLRMVTSFLQLLSLKYADKLDDTANEYIQYAVDGSKRMYELLNGLLAYSRVQTKGKDFSSINTNRVLNNVLNNLSLKIEERHAKIRFDELPVLYADETQITQLFQNLLDNSLKFSIREPDINITANSEANYCTFSIRDKGMGIEPQYFEKIFQLFQRLHLKEQYEGTGIGLAICKRIVERHGGRIWVESEPGYESEFFFTIPKK